MTEENQNQEQNQEQNQGNTQPENEAGQAMDKTENTEQQDANEAAEESAAGSGNTQNTDTPEAAEDLFDLMGEAGKKHKKPKREPSNNTASSGSQAAQNKQKQEKKEEKRYPSGSTIVYSGHKIELPEEMTAAGILDFLADDFPELTKDTTELTFDEARGRIVPTRKALKKGTDIGKKLLVQVDRDPRRVTGAIPVETTIPAGPAPPVRRVLDREGVYEIRNTDLGCFIARVPATMDLGLTEGAYLKIPKAPVRMLEKTLAIFKERPHQEALVTIVYDHRDEKHHLVWVEQETTAISIDYDAVPESEHLTTLLEIHSHNAMPAYFSRTDDGSEIKSTGLYGVIGRVDRDRPEARFRFSCGAHFRPLHAEAVFENPARIRELIQEHPA